MPRILGTYELEGDAARAYDKGAKILGTRVLNFPNSELDIEGPRSKGADRQVAVAIEAAKKSVETDGKNQAYMEMKIVDAVKAANVLIRGDPLTLRYITTYPAKTLTAPMLLFRRPR